MNFELINISGLKLRILVIIYDAVLKTTLPSSLHELIIYKGRWGNHDEETSSWISLIEVMKSFRHSQIRKLRLDLWQSRLYSPSPVSNEHPEEFDNKSKNQYLIGRNFMFPMNLRELSIKGRDENYRLKEDIQFPPTLTVLKLHMIHVAEVTKIPFPKSLKFLIIASSNSSLHGISISSFGETIFHGTSLQYLHDEFRPL
ncbi:uncharacterized protein RJT20DRAFT_54742 [Scheffersomyces xylosifermentans]|uniref:uncharacterized protein n=1 Tax=Scheffersomyces xylosifermentans TaxID=1304137 RepID=UPI00315C5A46